MCIQIIFQMCTINLTVHHLLGFLGKQVSKFPLASERCTCHGLRSQNHCMFAIRSWQATLPRRHPSEGPQSQRSKVLRLFKILSTKGSPSYLLFNSPVHILCHKTSTLWWRLLPPPSHPNCFLPQNPSYKYFSPAHWELQRDSLKAVLFPLFCGKPNSFLLKQSTWLVRMKCNLWGSQITISLTNFYLLVPNCFTKCTYNIFKWNTACQTGS